MLAIRKFPSETEVEETIIIRKRITKEKSTDMDGNCFKQKCRFDGWDWKKYPVAWMSCPCPKCSLWI